MIVILADVVFLTNDNPRGEDPGEIIDQIKKGFERDNYSIFPERAEAIHQALSIAKDGDIVLIAGKGHEDYQIFGNQKIHFDDREVAREWLSQNFKED